MLLASIYEEKSTSEIAAQVGLSENATLQLLFRARGAFKKALLGDVDTNGMSMGAILSVAARKAGEEAKKVGVQAMVLVLFLALSIGAFVNFNGQGKPAVAPVAEAPNSSNNTDSNATAPVAEEPMLQISTVVNVKERPEVPIDYDTYDPNVLSFQTSSYIASMNENAEVFVYRDTKGSSTVHIQGKEGLDLSFTYDPTSATPISNLLTQTQVTLAARRDNADYRDILASNAEELQRLARMVADMLYLAKTERSANLPHKEKFFAALEVLALCEFYEAVAEEKKISMATSGDGEILGDRLMFRRAVSNLLSNALRHTPEGGAVEVVIVSNELTTEVRVENTGPEIDPQVLPRLFDRFFRADPSRSHPDSDGAGLGLSITKAIAEIHGGTASVTSDHGKTRFFLRFPHKNNEVG